MKNQAPSIENRDRLRCSVLALLPDINRCTAILHPVQQASQEATCVSSFDSASGMLSIPARTPAVFVQTDHQSALPLLQIER